MIGSRKLRYVAYGVGFGVFLVGALILALITPAPNESIWTYLLPPSMSGSFITGGAALIGITYFGGSLQQ